MRKRESSSAYEIARPKAAGEAVTDAPVWKRITGIRSVATVTSVEMMSRLNETHWPVRN